MVRSEIDIQSTLLNLMIQSSHLGWQQRKIWDHTFRGTNVHNTVITAAEDSDPDGL